MNDTKDLRALRHRNENADPFPLRECYYCKQPAFQYTSDLGPPRFARTMNAEMVPVAPLTIITCQMCADEKHLSDTLGGTIINHLEGIDTELSRRDPQSGYPKHIRQSFHRLRAHSLDGQTIWQLTTAWKFSVRYSHSAVFEVVRRRYGAVEITREYYICLPKDPAECWVVDIGNDVAAAIRLVHYLKGLLTDNELVSGTQVAWE